MFITIEDSIVKTSHGECLIGKVDVFLQIEVQVLAVVRVSIDIVCKLVPVVCRTDTIAFYVDGRCLFMPVTEWRVVACKRTHVDQVLVAVNLGWID